MTILPSRHNVHISDITTIKMAPTSITSTLNMGNSVKIPQIGFGVYQSLKDTCVKSCLTALELGYRHIDTAQYYENEEEVGQAVQKSGLPRKDVFLTTKILTAGGSVDKSYESCVKSVKKLDPSPDEAGYADLFLIHAAAFGAAKRKEVWLALEKLYNEGKAKSIGVSNYGIQHIEEMKQFAQVWPPHVNQIELHPWAQQREIVDYCQKNGIVIEAYCPIVRNTKAEDPTLVKISEKHNVSPNQVLIRWSLQKGFVPLPKSDNAGRIKQNADVFGFALDQDDMSALDSLDQGREGAVVMTVDN